jgi:hypothetical protein
MTPPTKPPRNPTGEHQSIRVVETDELPVIRDEDVDRAAQRDSSQVFKPVTSADVSDLALMPRHLRMLQMAHNELNEKVRGPIAAALKRIEERQIEHERFAAAAVGDINARLDQIILALGVGK